MTRKIPQAGAARLATTALAAVLACPPALAAAPPRTIAPEPAPPAGEPAATADDIFVTAPRTRGAVVTDVQPEVVLNNAVIQSLGAADLTEVFRELAPEIGGTPGQAGGRSSPPVVLVDGQRIAAFSSIKDFPPEAVARIDVFPEKVALQYGFAPDQRVVNVVLRGRYQALTVLGRYTLAPDTWRGVYRGKINYVRIGDGGHSNLALDYAHVESIFDTTTLAGPTIGSGEVPDALRHTLLAQDDRLTASALANHKYGDTVLEFTASLDLDAIQTRPGLSDTDGALLVAEGLPYLISGPLGRRDETVQARAGLVANGKVAGWHWSAIGRIDDSSRVTRTAPAAAAGPFASILLPTPSLIGENCGATPGSAIAATTACVSTHMFRAAGDLYLNGDLFELPAGHVTAALRGGIAYSRLRAVSADDGNRIDRREASGQANLDLPLAAAGSAIGRLSIGGNGEVRHVTGFGALPTAGATLDWAPVRAIDLLATFSRGRQAPSLLQLGEARLVTPDLRGYDFVVGTTTIVTRYEGGNAGLTPATARVAKLRLQLSPAGRDMPSFSAEYSRQAVRNPILTIAAATAATAAAFPRLAQRAGGYLTAIDLSPVNGDERVTQQLRYGVNWSTGLGRAWAPRGGTVADHRDQFQVALYDSWTLEDRLRLKSGQARLDLLHGDVIGDGGGTPAHRIELQTSLARKTLSADLSAVWQTRTTARAGLLAADTLAFTQGVTLNARLQLNLAYQHWLTRLLPFLHGTLNLSADNLLGAHTTVRDGNGLVPLAFARSYLNPTGRTFRITLRKRFH